MQVSNRQQGCVQTSEASTSLKFVLLRADRHYPYNVVGNTNDYCASELCFDRAVSLVTISHRGLLTVTPVCVYSGAKQSRRAPNTTTRETGKREEKAGYPKYKHARQWSSLSVV